MLHHCAQFMHLQNKPPRYCPTQLPCYIIQLLFHLNSHSITSFSSHRNQVQQESLDLELEFDQFNRKFKKQLYQPMENYETEMNLRATELRLGLPGSDELEK